MAEDFPDYGYVNLEDPDLRRAAEADGADFMATLIARWSCIPARPPLRKASSS